MTDITHQIYSEDEALQKSIEYFNGDDLAAKVFVDKYALRDHENNILEDTPHKMHKRLAKEFARIESKKFKVPLSEDDIFSYFEKFKYIIPQGSPMYGIGNNYQIISLSNCYLLDVPLDSYNSILLVDQELVNICKRRGGVGIDLSNLRPTGALTKNSSRTSTGILSWMERYSNSIREVGQSGRRGALMLTLSIHHPDIYNFVTAKNDRKKVTGANISVRLTDEFLNAVKKDKNFELRFPVNYKELGIEPIISKQVNAKELWNLIIHSATMYAEPGLLMWDNVQKYTPSDCYDEYKSMGVNPCSEICLSPLDSCRLLCINLLSYVKNPFTKKAEFDYELFYAHAKIAQRLMDDLVDLESEKISSIIKKINSDSEPTEVKQFEKQMWERIKKYNDNGRRTGTGITALGDTIAALNIKYGTPESIKLTEKIYRELKLACYESSVDMAEELGSFKEFDFEKEKDNEFLLRIKEEDNKLYNRMKKFGRRNIALTTTAPTGSVSVLTQTTSGIEPLFMMEYKRRKKISHDDKTTKADFIDDLGDKWQEFSVYHSSMKKWMEITGDDDIKNSPWYGACAEDIDWINRVKLQSVAQKHVCHAISSTINLPETISEDEVGKIYETAFSSGLKGITVYRSGSRSGVLIANNDNNNEKRISKNNAPKRPTSLPCDIHHITVMGDKWIVLIGKLGNDPYEVFAFKKNKIQLADKFKEGKLSKVKSGIYNLEVGDGDILLEDIVSLFEKTEHEAFTRMISLSLRHGADIKHLFEQLNKSEGNITSFSKAIGRTLKKYVNGLSISCEACGEKDSVVMQEGCFICKNCGHSKCQ